MCAVCESTMGVDWRAFSLLFLGRLAVFCEILFESQARDATRDVNDIGHGGVACVMGGQQWTERGTGWMPFVLRSLSVCACVSKTAASVAEQELIDAVVELDAIIEDHVRRNELDAAEDAREVRDRIKARLSRYVAGGSESIVYNADALETEEHLVAQPWTWQNHMSPVLGVFEQALLDVVQNSSLDKSVAIFNNYRGKFYELPQEQSDAAVAAGHRWNLAISETVLCIGFLTVLVPALIVGLTKLFCNCSGLKLHRLLSLVVAFPLLASCVTGAAWMFCDQVRGWCGVDACRSYMRRYMSW